MKKIDVHRYFGTYKAIADFLDISPAAVKQWPDIIPERAASRLAHFTRGRQRRNTILRMDYSYYDKRAKSKKGAKGKKKRFGLTERSVTK